MTEIQTRTTLTQFIIESQSKIGGSGNFTGLLADIAGACKAIAHAVSKGGLADVLGSAGSDNVQGEVQQKLDVLSNDLMISANNWRGHVAAMASEELDDILTITPPVGAKDHGHYLLVFDPLDGSSNINANISIGTIFSVLRHPDPSRPAVAADFLQPGNRQICAGYALYGPTTMIVLTTGQGVNGFTLDRDVGEFYLTHPQMRIPEQTSEFAINMSNERFWLDPVKRYINECRSGKTGVRQRDFNMRWVASMVAEVHRILTRGGVFMYPRDTKDLSKPGRLRLLYEASPMAMIVDQAGGAATEGKQPILEVMPTALHQRIGISLGSKEEIERIVHYHCEMLPT